MTAASELPKFAAVSDRLSASVKRPLLKAERAASKFVSISAGLDSVGEAYAVRETAGENVPNRAQTSVTLPRRAHPDGTKRPNIPR